MKYKISYSNPQQHFINIEFIASVKANTTRVQLPSWRPGRYELGNFAKNIQQWQAYNEEGEKLHFKKITKDCWEVNTEAVDELVIKYNYYANELNAGSSYFDETQLYVNPVNCFLYIEEKQNEECELELVDMPDYYQVATGLEHHTQYHFRADNFHQLVDCPFIASDTLKHEVFDCKGILFNLWFQGECKPDFKKITKHFKQYTEKQIELFGDFPVNEYHYLFQILPYAHYHGVEHYNSTVLALGPTYKLMEKELYDELLGVSCHELFHAWNIKAIRPKEMYPYNYKEENYSTLGYVSEGVTTYYGDLLLHRSEVFNDEEYFKILADQIQRHLHNFARNTYSVAESSFDTWLDGYVKGIPNRKLSIYSDGCLIAFIIDVMIMELSKNKKSLDDAMQALYNDYSKEDRGYTDEDYINITSNLAKKDLSQFFKTQVYGAGDYTVELKHALSYLGLELKLSDSENHYETYYGFKAASNGEITDVYPGSIADIQGIVVGDKITHINDYLLDKNLDHWTKFYGMDEVKLVVQRKYGRTTVHLKPMGQKFYQKVSLVKQDKINKEQENVFTFWKYRKVK